MYRHNNCQLGRFMKTIWAKNALLKDGWANSVQIDIENGFITKLVKDSKPSGFKTNVLIPAQSNLHSHTFQRAMAGMTEAKGNPTDSFWTWRKLMYQFLDILTPDDIESIATFAMMEMAETGFAAVAEFHYIHNEKNGVRYNNPAEMTNRIMSAGSETGIGLTHLPVLYSQGGIDGRNLEGGQKRFETNISEIDNQISEFSSKKTALDWNYGVAPHSLRAVSRDELDEVAKLFPEHPIHIHIAEQMGEVEEIKNGYGSRPVEWLLNNHHIDNRWCLIHSTHLTETETTAIAQSKAVVGLCPITESSLGDGIFNGVNFKKNEGKFGFGTDSNIQIDLRAEMRTFEYSQRLKHQARAVLATETQSTGRYLHAHASKSAAIALGRKSGCIEVGNYADLAELPHFNPDLEGLTNDMALDSWIFAPSGSSIENLWSAGRHIVKNKIHIKREKIKEDYTKTIKKLRSRI